MPSRCLHIDPSPYQGTVNPDLGKHMLSSYRFWYSPPAKLKKIVYICVPFCPYSLMDRISDSGSDGCGSIPHGGTKMTHGNHESFLVSTPVTDVTSPFRVASGKETAQWAFPTSSLRQQDRLHRPLPLVGSGVIAKANDAALKCLFSPKVAIYTTDQAI